MLYFFVNSVLFCLATERMGQLLKTINSTTKTLQSKFEILAGNIERVNQNLSVICNSSSICNGVEPNSLTTVANFSSLPDVQVELKNIQEINSNNLSKNAEKVI